MRHKSFLLALAFCGLITGPVSAQEETVTLLLTDGKEIKCTVYEVRQTEIYFRASSPQQAYQYGEALAVAKIARVRLADGRSLKPQEFLQYWKGELVPPVAAAVAPPSPPARTASPPPAEYGPGLRLQSVVTGDTLRGRGVGLRLPEMPRMDSTPALNYNEIADLLAESGLAGKLLLEIGSGDLKKRQLTPSQRQMVDAVLQSRVWAVRKRELRAAHMQGLVEFEKIYKNSSANLFELFKLRPANPALVFLEFVHYLRAENAHLFSDRWERVEKTFSPAVVAALRDLLNNYEDWYYLYGQELEKQK